jgi:hypothetical protein
MPSFFGGKDRAGASAVSNERVARHSSGWGQLLERLRTEESLRVLDIGATSSTNINFVTALGHSIYLANLVEEAAKREWLIAQDDGSAAQFDVQRFLDAHLSFSGRGFDVVLFWDTADYLPEGLIGPVLERIHGVMEPGGQMLAMFHSQPNSSAPPAPKPSFCRYHLTDANKVDVQWAGEYPLLNSYTNRQIEQLLGSFNGFHFFLGKDNVREVVVTR